MDERTSALAAIIKENEKEMKMIEEHTTRDPKGTLCIEVDSDTARIVKEYRDLPIHRIMPIDRFRGLFGSSNGTQGTNYLHDVTKWEDVNEGFYFRQPFRLADGTPVEIKNWLKNLYGQCWSLNDESETCYMWDVYGKDSKDDVVQISSTIGRLWDTLPSNNSEISVDESGLIYASIGRVGYAPLPVFVSFIKRSIDDPQHRNLLAMKSLYLKNSPYQYEREIRLVLSLEKNPKGSPFQQSGDGIVYNVNPMSMLTRVVASPYMKPYRFKELKRLLESSSLNGVVPLKQSELFLSPEADSGDCSTAEEVRKTSKEVFEGMQNLLTKVRGNNPIEIQISAELLSESIKLLSMALDTLNNRQQSTALATVSSDEVSTAGIKSKIHKILELIQNVPATESHTSPIWAAKAILKASFLTFDNAILSIR